MRRAASIAAAFGIAAGTVLFGQQSPAPPQPPAFRSAINLNLVDVVVRDRNGAVVKDLTADDFELFEDGVRQTIVTFAFENITSTAAPIETASTLAAPGGARTPAT